MGAMNVRKIFGHTAAALTLAVGLSSCDDSSADKMAKKIAACLSDKNVGDGDVTIFDKGSVSFTQLKDNKETVYTVKASSSDDSIERAHYEDYTYTSLMPIVVGQVIILMPMDQTDTRRVVDSVSAPDKASRPIFAALGACVKSMDNDN